MNYKDILKKVSMVSITDMFVRLKPFIFIPIISKTLGASAYGTWAQIMITVSMLLPLAMLGMDFGLLRYLPGKGREESRKELGSVFSLVLAVASLGALVLIIMSDFISKKFFGSIEFSILVKMGGLYLITMALRELFLAYIRARERMSLYAVMVLTDALLSVSLAIWLAYSGYGIKILFLMLLVLNIIFIAVSYVFMARDVGFVLPRPSFDSRLSEYLKYSLPFLPMLWLLWVMNSSDRYFLGYFRTMEEVGVYSACYSISYFVINMIGGPAYLVFQPIIMRVWNNSDRELASRLVNNLIKYVLFFAVPAAFLFVMTAKSVIPFLTTRDFMAGVGIIPLILLSYIFYNIAIFVEVMIYLTNDTRKLLFTYSIPAVFNLSLNAILIPKLGMLGAGLATLCSFSVQLLCTIFVARLKGVFELKIDIAFVTKVIIASLLMSMAIARFPRDSILKIGFMVLCALIVYIGMVFMMKTFKKSEIEKIGSMFLPSK